MRTSRIYLMSEEELIQMRKSCQLAATILHEVTQSIKPGMSTQDLDDHALRLTLEAGAYPAPLNYPHRPTNPRNPLIQRGGFPKSICTSVNHVVCHGIPRSEHILVEGDIINVDITCELNGYYGDTSKTVAVGSISERAQRLLDFTHQAMMAGIAAIRPYGRLIAIGKTISDLAHQHGFSVVRDFTGHGIGKKFHTDPTVCHFPDPGTDCQLVPGMIFTVEPMINEGSYQTYVDRKDGWTALTRDGRLSAQFEHTVLVTESGYEILTLGPEEK
jgi:methionyl aminopeptidase